MKIFTMLLSLLSVLSGIVFFVLLIYGKVRKDTKIKSKVAFWGVLVSGFLLMLSILLTDQSGFFALLWLLTICVGIAFFVLFIYSLVKKNEKFKPKRMALGLACSISISIISLIMFGVLQTPEDKVKYKQTKEENGANIKVEKEDKEKAEKEAKAKVDEEAKAKVDEEAKAEKEAKAKVEKEAKAKVEEEAKVKAAEETKVKEELTKNTYKSGMHKVGVDIPAGEYVLFAEGRGYFSLNADSTGNLDSIIANENFDYNTIITILDGQYLELKSAKAIPINLNPIVNTLKAGTFKVGLHIPAGEYKIVSNGGGYVQVSMDSLHQLDGIITNDNFDGERYITVSDGQYLTLVRATITQ